ncbi:hypothetical protein CPJCM30710_16160 [Clostridium polyendosporum]|uniref:Uncharacterized protein n=1 Tax=Clostridium polyendosporum TaxID=69208 RepID=A0A919VG05_9CLOT|nr:hypothetical protein [Clostridium polyendosporum]GIM28950.1 hypothetical protein CPJCM30710_16160 [Clostridium polyendosporum]
MNGFSIDNIVMLFIVLAFVYLTIKFIKGFIKFIVIVLLILTLGVSAYNIFIVQKPISYEINRYKTDYVYFHNIRSISSEASTVINEIKENKNVQQNINKLKELRNNAEGLNHSQEISGLHDKYIESLDSVISVCNGYSTAKEVEQKVQKLDELSKGLDVKFKDVLLMDR